METPKSSKVSGQPNPLFVYRNINHFLCDVREVKTGKKLYRVKAELFRNSVYPVYKISLTDTTPMGWVFGKWKFTFQVQYPTAKVYPEYRIIAGSWRKYGYE